MSCLSSCQVADSEVKAGTLQLTVERLSGALAKVEESEGALRDKVQGLTDTLEPPYLEHLAVMFTGSQGLLQV